jgi:hypothetical protein
LFGSPDAICSALTSFSAAQVETTEGEVLPLFNGHIVENLYGLRKLKFRTNPKSDSTTRSAALISGSVQQATWRYSATSRQVGETARIVFATQLNLTRFIQAQALKKTKRISQPKLASGYVLGIEPDEKWYVNEFPLVPATNLIIGDFTKYAFALKQPRSVQLHRYLRIVRGLLSRVMSDAFSGEIATFKRFPNYSLKEIEFYWEFDQTNPIDYVVSLRPNVIAASEHFSERSFSVEDIEFRLNGQSPCLKVHLTRNILIKVYAKTNRRVRFEVTLKSDAINKVTGSRTSSTLDQLILKVPFLAEEAATRLNSLLQSIAGTPTPKSSFTAMQLLHEIAAACDTPFVSETVVSALVTFGRITPHNNDPLLQTIHRLRDRGVLRNLRQRSKVYVVTDEFSEPLERLRQFR